MPLRVSLCVALCWVAVLPAGCGRKTEPAPQSEPPREREPAPSVRQVTLHVKDMTERLDLA